MKEIEAEYTQTTYRVFFIQNLGKTHTNNMGKKQMFKDMKMIQNSI